MRTKTSSMGIFHIIMDGSKSWGKLGTIEKSDSLVFTVSDNRDQLL